jgi:hypothetical protein
MVESRAGLERGGQQNVYDRQEELQQKLEDLKLGLIEHSNLINAQSNLQLAIDRYNKENRKNVSAEEAAIIRASLPDYVQAAYSDYLEAKQDVIPYAKKLATGRQGTDVTSTEARAQRGEAARGVRGAFAQRLSALERAAAIGPTVYTGKVVPISAGGRAREAGEAQVSAASATRSNAIQLENELSDMLKGLYQIATGERQSAAPPDSNKKREAYLTNLMRTLFGRLAVSIPDQFEGRDADTVQLGIDLEKILGIGSRSGLAGDYATLTEFLRTKPEGLPLEVMANVRTFNKRLYDINAELQDVRKAIAESSARGGGESKFISLGLIDPREVTPEQRVNITRLGHPMTIRDIDRIGIDTMDEFLPGKVVSAYRELQSLKSSLRAAQESPALELNRRPGDESRFSPDKEERRLIIAIEGKRGLPANLVIDINTLVPTDRAFNAEIRELIADLAPEAGVFKVKRRTPNPDHSRNRLAHSRPSSRVSNPGNPEIARKAASLRESLDHKFSSLKERTSNPSPRLSRPPAQLPSRLPERAFSPKARMSNPAQLPERTSSFTEVLDYDRAPSARVNPFSSRPSYGSRPSYESSYGKNAICIFATELDIPCNESDYTSSEEDQKHYALCLLQLKRDIDPTIDISDDLHEIASGSGNAAYYGRLAREVARLVRRASREGVDTQGMLVEVMDRCRN